MKRIAIITGCVALLGWTFRCDRDDPDDDESAVAGPTAMLENRLWVSHMPERANDEMGFVVFLKEGQGAFGRASVWSFYQEVFFFARQGESFDVRFPLTEREKDIVVSTWECEVDDFELCGEVSGDDFGPTKIYSRWDMDVDGKVLGYLPMYVQMERAFLALPQ